MKIVGYWETEKDWEKLGLRHNCLRMMIEIDKGKKI